MRILLTGATGFIGRRLDVALRAAGHRVVCAVREPKSPGDVRSDFVRDRSIADWLPRLAGIDAVVNTVGILRERGEQTFAALHVEAPSALFIASVEAGVKKIIQVSALGADDQASSRYHLSKKTADDLLASLAVDWVIVQPSLVYGRGGASAKLFTLLACLPLIPLPGDGRQEVQPIHIDDLCTAVVSLIEGHAFDRHRIALVGQRPVLLRELIASLRRQMQLPDALFVRVPMPLVQAAARLRIAPLLDSETLAMLVRGNVASPANTEALLGRPPRPIERFIPPEDAAAVATAARLSWLLPLLRFAIAFVWIATGIVSLGVYPVSGSYALLARVGLGGVAATIALYGAALLDLAFGIGTLALSDRRWLWRAQMALIAAYMVLITLFLPEYWLHPYGPLTKNLPMLAAILLLHEFETHRPGRG